MSGPQWSVTTAYAVVGMTLLARHNWPKRIAAWAKAPVKTSSPLSGVAVPGSTGAGDAFPAGGPQPA
jgi:hypothetical protein